MLIIEQLGCEGYGIFWILVETLRDQKDYRYPIRLISALARKYNTTEAKMATVIKEYGLFKIDKESFFFSDSLNRRMKSLDSIIEKRKIAGKKSGEVRKQKSIEHKLNMCSTDVERKDKIRKEKIKEDISLLKNLVSSKSANEILNLDSKSTYKALLSKQTVFFIEKYGGLKNIKMYLDDDTYNDWVLTEIEKYKGEINESY
jgi:hypothetical protein